MTDKVREVVMLDKEVLTISIMMIMYIVLMNPTEQETIAEISKYCSTVEEREVISSLVLKLLLEVKEKQKERK